MHSVAWNIADRTQQCTIALWVWRR